MPLDFSFTQEVTVLGEVQNATSHVYKPGLGRDDSISLSGGATQRADHRLLYMAPASRVHG
jgi:protein involved in polysaccharide export with SLBB domain